MTQQENRWPLVVLRANCHGTGLTPSSVLVVAAANAAMEEPGEPAARKRWRCLSAPAPTARSRSRVERARATSLWGKQLRVTQIGDPVVDGRCTGSLSAGPALVEIAVDRLMGEVQATVTRRPGDFGLSSVPGEGCPVLGIRRDARQAPPKEGCPALGDGDGLRVSLGWDTTPL